MFIFLNRLLRLFIAAFWIGALVLLWGQRERGRPVLDLYAAWEANNYRVPQPLPRMRGTVHRVLNDTTVQIRAEDGRLWNLGVAGFGGVDPFKTDRHSRLFARESLSTLETLTARQPVEIALTITNDNRTGWGFFYLPTNRPVALEMLAEGRWQVRGEAVFQLPFREQLEVRAAERRARAERRGLWAADSSPVE